MTRVLEWRQLHRSDLSQLGELAGRCVRADGGSTEAGTEEFIGRCYLLPGKQTIGALDSAGRVVAAAAVRACDGRLDAAGQVDPAWRGRGLGRRLLDWTISQRREARTLRVLTEAVTPAAERLYARYALVRAYAEDVMRRDLDAPLPALRPPPGITFVPWSAPIVPVFFGAYRASFADASPADGAAAPPLWTFREWVNWTVEEAFRPELSLLATTGGGPAGFVTCTPDWILQVGVAPAWRGQGLGSALIVAALRAMRSAGATECHLEVNVTNPRAATLYRRLDFVTVGRRARYETQPS
ncbi:GNAT family N-acetyltransferase [Actinopolymorpha alba]|uniref:GNAT family N-acetyltransferase n=1 Tax=Actinopolymorpha alba TaxID=533267 RepID=UPI00037BAE38|nr:GNAT family N-acetyltransferase [Actinopolymorpha alba]